MKATAALIFATTLVSATLYAGSQLPQEQAIISISPVRAVPIEKPPGRAKEFTVTVQPVDGGKARYFKVRGPDKLLNLDEKASARIVGERLLVYTSSVIAIFDLESGDQVLDLIAASEVVVSRSGHRVAFETLQPRFLPPEATSSVIQVIDVPTLTIEPVFPEESIIAPAQFGQLLAWVEDPQDRHSAGRLVFSPDGSQIAFFCTHGPPGMTGPREVYLVVVNLSPDLARSRFVHHPFDWRAHLRPGQVPTDREPYFAVGSITWTDEDTLVVNPPKYARWLEAEIVVPVPDLGEGTDGDQESP